MLETKYNFKEVEKYKYEKWLKNDYFKSGDKSKKPFCIVLPPPNITGDLHLGHALDTSLQDIIARYKRLKGYDVLWLPGMDHAAIATENKVVNKLKTMNIDKYELGREEFIKECFKWKDVHSDNIRNQWAKLGLSLDYTKERFTLDEKLSIAVKTAFVNLYNKGYIYKGKRIINWDPVAKTALSNEEVIYKEEKGKLYYLKYFFENSNKYITVATTRPETIYGDVAIAVNPDDKKYTDLIGKTVIVPLVNRKIKIIKDKRVILDFGTGALKITPAHSLDDYEIGLTHNLEVINTITPDGHMNENAKPYEGLTILETRKKIIEDLNTSGMIEKIEDYMHSVGHSERTDAVVEPYLSTEWFMKMKDIASNVLKNQKTENKINFIPKRFEKVFNHWLSSTHDWCISRQLWWGHRIPVWYKNDKMYVGIYPPKEKGWVQDEEVLDTWFSSGLWPFATLGWPENTEDLKRYFPTDVLVTGYDIIFFWVARMAYASDEFMNNIPFKDCLIHGLIRDKFGNKMSKSLGNGINPMDMIDKYGSDALRLYLSTSGAPGMDLKFSEETLASTWNFINKLWNASRYVLMNIESLKDDIIDYTNISISDKWILTELNNIIKKVETNMEKYRFNDVKEELYTFTWNKFCDSFIELTKGTNNINTKKVLLKVLTNILQMLHPFIPFVTDEIYSMLPVHEDNILYTTYPIYNKKEIYTKDYKLINEVLENITEIRNFKVENKITKDTPVYIKTDLKVKDIFIKLLKLNETNFLNKSHITYKSSIIELNFYIDEKEKKDSIESEIKNLEISINKRQKLLNNKDYVNKAPKNIVDMDREKLKKELELLDILKSKLN